MFKTLARFFKKYFAKKKQRPVKVTAGFYLNEKTSKRYEGQVGSTPMNKSITIDFQQRREEPTFIQNPFDGSPSIDWGSDDSSSGSSSDSGSSSECYGGGDSGGGGSGGDF